MRTTSGPGKSLDGVRHEPDCSPGPVSLQLGASTNECVNEVQACGKVLAPFAEDGAPDLQSRTPAVAAERGT